MTPIPYLNLPSFEHSLVAERARERVEPGAMLELELDLLFAANGVTCRDSRVIRKSNLWRDFFPGNLERQLLGTAVGERVEADFTPGALTEYQEGERFTAPRGAFRSRKLVRRDLESWLAKQRQRMLAEDGMSETIQNVLWAIFAIAIVGIVAAIIQNYVVSKAGEIR